MTKTSHSSLPSLRSRIRNGTLLALAIMMLLGLYEMPRIFELGGAIRAVLENNYISIVAGRHMQTALDRLQIAELHGDAHPVLVENREDFDYWLSRESLVNRSR